MRPALSSLVTGLALLVGAGAAAVLPIASDGCPGAASSLLAPEVQARTSPAPEQDTQQAEADQAAADAAQAAVVEAAARNAAAQSALGAAGPSTSDPNSLSGSYRVTSAQDDVDAAQAALNSARSTLASDKQARETYRNEVYALSTSSFYDDRVARDEEQVDEAVRELTQAQAALAELQQQRSAAAVAASVVDETARGLASAQATLEAVQYTQRSHLEAFAAERSRWQEGERLAQVAAARQERERLRCRDTGRGRLAVAGATALIGGAISGYSFVQRRR